MTSANRLAGLFKSIGFLVVMVAGVVVSSAVLAQTPNLVIRLAPRGGARDSKQPAMAECGSDDEKCNVFSCPSSDLETCVQLAYFESLGIPSDASELQSDGVSLKLRPLSSKKGARRGFVVADIYDITMCGAGNCPMMVLRRVNSTTWERVVNGWGIFVDSFDVAGTPNPWIFVTTSGGSCKLLISIYEPTGSSWRNVLDEAVETCRYQEPKRRVSTPAGLNYARLTCPVSSGTAVDGAGRPEFTTESFPSDDRYSFSIVRGECEGWPKPDEYNSVFIIFDDKRGGFPVASGYGIGWRRAGHGKWLLFAASFPEDIQEPLVKPLLRADDLAPPSACRPKGCYQVVRWIAPGVVAIDWYGQSSKPSRAIHSDVLLVPEVLEYP